MQPYPYCGFTHELLMPGDVSINAQLLKIKVFSEVQGCMNKFKGLKIAPVGRE